MELYFLKMVHPVQSKFIQFPELELFPVCPSLMVVSILFLYPDAAPVFSSLTHLLWLLLMMYPLWTDSAQWLNSPETHGV